ILEKGEAETQQRLAVLPWLREGTEMDLFGTLCVYYLDAGSSLSKTAEQLYVHKNTVKYRIQQVEQRLGYRVDQQPEAIELDTACALVRLLGETTLGQSDNALPDTSDFTPWSDTVKRQCFVVLNKALPLIFCLRGIYTAEGSSV